MSFLTSNFAKTVYLSAILIILWLMKSVVVILLGSVLFGIIISGILDLIGKKLKISRLKSTLILISAILLVSFIFILSLLPLLEGQLQDFIRTVPQTFQQTLTDIEGLIGFSLPFSAMNFSSILDFAKTPIRIAFNTLFSFFLMLIIGLYLAVDSKNYMKMYYSFFKRNKRKVEKISQDIYNNLNLWFYSRLVSMFIVTILVSIGLFFIGIPYYFLFGLLSGLLSFVPNVGPFLAFLPALLVSLAISPIIALYTSIWYGIVELIEGNFLTPIVEQKLVSDPAALQLAFQLVFAVLFGLTGIFIAIPILVVLRSYLEAEK